MNDDNRPVVTYMSDEIQPTYPPKFKINEVVQHVKNREYYRIVGLPVEYVLEHNHAPAYAYRMTDGRICVRQQDEMEDGRFVSVDVERDGWPP